MAILRSMTGFARVRRVTERGEMVMTVKSVNHRALDVHLHIPADLDVYANSLRGLVKSKISRGHVDLRLFWDRSGGGHLLSLNRPLLDSWMAAFREAKDRFTLDCEPNLNDAFRIPGMLTEADSDIDVVVEGLLTDLGTETLEAFNKSREKEGGELRILIMEANGRILEHAAELAVLRARVMPLLQQRLQERLHTLIGSANIEPQRLLQETAILADRSDVTEEIHRLSIHARQVAELLEKGGEIGKRLDFLMQEMGRETNTVLSKTNGAGDTGLRVTDIGIAIKAEIERIREQSLNVE